MKTSIPEAAVRVKRRTCLATSKREWKNRQGINCNPMKTKSSLECEMMILGCMMASPISLRYSINNLKVEDFNDARHCIIFESMKEINEKGDSCDIHKVCNFLTHKNQLEMCGGVAYLAMMVNAAGISDYLKEYIEVMKSKNQQRMKQVDNKPEIKQEEKIVQKKSVEPTTPLICSERKKEGFWKSLKKWLTAGWQSTNF